MNLSLRLCQKLLPEESQCDSIFPRTEALLNGSSDYQRAVEYVSGRKNMERYASRIDYLFNELLPQWKPHCRAYYNGDGPQLRFHPEATPAQIAAWDAFLVLALEVAKGTMEQKRARGWASYQEVVYAIAAAA